MFLNGSKRDISLNGLNLVKLLAMTSPYDYGRKLLFAKVGQLKIWIFGGIKRVSTKKFRAQGQI
jgi:hypothetical protein